MPCPSCHTENDPAAQTCVSCRSPLPRAAGPSVLAGRYEIQSCLGKGGMGIVYKAYDRVLEEIVAIKVLLGQDAAGSMTARRFRSEIKLARRVTHRNVCRIHDYGEDGGREFISMQFVEGADLRARVRQGGGLPAEEAFEVALQIAEGLQAIHDEGIVHRDLKLANVMIDSQGVVRLMDFGIAKATEGAESLTGTGHIVGTPEYMSPEQIHAQPLDARSDVYSMGIILYELFTGRVPFSAGTPVAVLMQHLHEEPRLDDAQASAIPAAVRGVIQKALAKERNARHGSARELARDLRAARPPATLSGTRQTEAAALAGLATVTRSGHIPSPFHRRPWLWALLLAALVAVPIGLWAAYRGLGLLITAPPSPAPPEVPTFVATARAPSPEVPVVGGAGVRPAPAASTVSRVSGDLQSACDAGQAAACSAAGQRHETGDGVVRDARRAAALYRRACDLGSASGCTRLGILHNAGQGVEKDVAAAAELYEKGCSGGDGPGCNNLGTMYEFGVIGFEPDAARAAAYYRRACELTDAAGCGNLGVVMLAATSPSGTARDEAVRLLRQGCSGDGPRACKKLRDLGLAP